MIAYHVQMAVPPSQPYHYKNEPRGFITPEQRRYPLAATIWGEARNQPVEGQRAVAHVILNRIAAHKKRYGHGLRGVVWKRKQFSCWNLGDANRGAFVRMLALPSDHPEHKAWERIKRLAERVYRGDDKDNTVGATFYATTTIRPYWRNDMKVVGVMYDHIFFKPMTAADRAKAARDRRANNQLRRARRIARHANRHKSVDVVRHHAKHVHR